MTGLARSGIRGLLGKLCIPSFNQFSPLEVDDPTIVTRRRRVGNRNYGVEPRVDT